MFKYIRALIISLFLVLLYGCSGSGSSEVVLEAVSERGYYISEHFGLKIDYIYRNEENIFIYENGNEIFVVFSQTKDEITDLASCNDYFSTTNYVSDSCVQIDGKLYSLAGKMDIFGIDEDLSLEENIKQLLIDKGKNPEECSIKILEKQSWSKEYDDTDPLRIYLEHLRSKEREISSETELILKIGAYKKLLREEDQDILNMLSEVERSLEEGDDDPNTNMFIGNAFWGPLRQNRCGVFEGQFLTNWKPGHLIYFPQRPNMLITVDGLAGGAGPDLQDVELAD